MNSICIFSFEPPYTSETDAVLAKAEVEQATANCAVLKAQINLRVFALIHPREAPATHD